MALSGTTTYFSTIQAADIIQDAFERCGIDFSKVSGNQLDSARRSIQMCMSNWSNRGPNLWKVVQRTTALTAAQNAGRMETMLTAPTAALYASEQMDSSTCKPCEKINGKWIGNSDDPDITAKVEAIYPNGGYVHCLGGVRCRGAVVSIYRPEQV